MLCLQSLSIGYLSFWRNRKGRMIGVIQDLWLCISRPSTFLFDFRFCSKITPIYTNSGEICSSILSALYLPVKIPLDFDQFDSFFCAPSMGDRLLITLQCTTKYPLFGLCVFHYYICIFYYHLLGASLPAITSGIDGARISNE